MAHLTHKLPWWTLPEAVKKDPQSRFRRREERVEFDKKVNYILTGISNAIQEFAATDKRSDEEKEEYDVCEWSSAFSGRVVIYGGGGSLKGLIQSVVEAYVLLNWYVVDEERIRKTMLKHRIDWLYENAGHGNGSHPNAWADKLRPILDESFYTGSHFAIPKKLDTQTVDGIRFYCAELFKTMYTRPDIFTHEKIRFFLTVDDDLYKKLGEYD